MANLIITIISIALVAIAVLMGAYYGGTAFSNGAISSQASQMISGADQIASAWQLYAVDHGGQHNLADWNNASGSTSLVPQYLSTFPVLPKSAQHGYDSDANWGTNWSTEGGWSYYYTDGSGLIQRGYSGAPPASTIAIGIFSYQPALSADWRNICTEAHKKLTGQTTLPVLSGSELINVTPASIFPNFGRAFCVNDNGRLTFVYKIF